MIIRGNKNVKIIKRIYYKLKWIFENNLSHRNYYKELELESIDDCRLRTEIQYALNNNKALCVGKIGATECYAVTSYLLFGKRELQKSFHQLCDWSGFFPREYHYNRLAKYAEIQIGAISSLDVMVEFRKCYEEFLLRSYSTKKLKTVSFQNFGPYNDNSWVELLKGRKVLVVHPFVPLINEQYNIREKIYPDGFLPEFELKTIKAVQSLGGDCNEKFDTWFESLDYMKNKIKEEEFDIALIGCGAYGLPLASEVKKMGKIAIHMGADVQLLFGIKGNRWDGTAVSEKLYNDYWVYPGEEYKPKSYMSVENGCYW